jgi:hypothetical protein
MELLAFDDQAISNLSTDDHDDDFGALRIHLVGDAKITESQLVVSQRIGSKLLDGTARGCRLIARPRHDAVAEDPLLPGW